MRELREQRAAQEAMETAMTDAVEERSALQQAAASEKNAAWKVGRVLVP
jgi:hypothetical protein